MHTCGSFSIIMVLRLTALRGRLSSAIKRVQTFSIVIHIGLRTERDRLYWTLPWGSFFSYQYNIVYVETKTSSQRRCFEGKLIERRPYLVHLQTRIRCVFILKKCQKLTFQGFYWTPFCLNKPPNNSRQKPGRSSCDTEELICFNDQQFLKL